MGEGGSDAPSISASTRLTVPAATPFIIAICTGSALLSLRVRLLSMPQARHAPAIAKIPAPPPFGPPPRQDNKSAPPRIAAAPTNSRLSTFSRKTSQAIASVARPSRRSEEHTSELQSLMRISYAVFCLKKKKKKHQTNYTPPTQHIDRQIAQNTSLHRNT